MYIRTFVTPKKQPGLAAHKPGFQKHSQNTCRIKNIVRNTNKSQSSRLSYTPLKIDPSNSCIVVKIWQTT
jgi:hypothetical protein